MNEIEQNFLKRIEQTKDVIIRLAKYDNGELPKDFYLNKLKKICTK